jgi:catalase
MPKVLEQDITPEVTHSPALSLRARPGHGGVQARRVAMLVADGVDGEALTIVSDALLSAGALPRWVGSRLGAVQTSSGEIEVDVTVEAMPSVLFDAVVIPDGASAIELLAMDGRVMEFVKDQYRHCKPMLVFGAGETLLSKAGVPTTLPSGEADPGLVSAQAADAADAGQAFMAALAAHRHFARETDPPRV